MSSHQFTTTLPLSQSYNQTEINQINDAVKKCVADMERRIKNSKKSNHLNTVYVTQPATAKSLSDADVVKCITWDYTLSPDGKNALIRYGASIFNKKVKKDMCDSTTSDIESNESTKSKKMAHFNKAGLYETAMRRFQNWPVTFTVDLKNDLTMQTYSMQEVESVKPNGTKYMKRQMVMTPRNVPIETQMLNGIKRMMVDGVNGGCSSRRRMKDEKQLNSTK